jgi:hypothetical protein
LSGGIITAGPCKPCCPLAAVVAGAGAGVSFPRVTMAVTCAVAIWPVDCEVKRGDSAWGPKKRVSLQYTKPLLISKSDRVNYN